jgi:hypothetical protein
MAQSGRRRPATEVRIFSDIYRVLGDAMNQLYTPANIKATTAKVISLEAPPLGRFVAGKFNRHLVPSGDLPPHFDWDKYEADFALIPDNLRQRVTDVMGANFHAANPLPMFTQVSDNVDQSHDLIIKPFVYNGTTYIGFLFLCPNSKRPP